MSKFVLFLYLFWMAFCANADVSFRVETESDPLGYEVILSVDGEIFISGGAAQFGIYKTASKERIGKICCRPKNKGYDGIFLLYKVGSTGRILYLNADHKNGGKRSTNVYLYDLQGRLIHKKKYQGRIRKSDVSVSPAGGKYFAIQSNERITIYSSKDFSIKNHLDNPEFHTELKFSISSRGDSVISYLEGKSRYFNINEGYEQKVIFCGDKGVKVNEIGFLGDTDKLIYRLDGYENICLKSGESELEIKKPAGRMISFFVDRDDNFILVVTAKGVFVYETKEGEKIGEFLVKPFYNQKFGENPDERPFFIKPAQYDDKKNFLTVRGGGGTGTLFKVGIVILN